MARSGPHAGRFPPRLASLQVGAFAQLRERTRIGKICALDAQRCTLRLFYRPDDIEEHVHATHEVESTELWPHALVYARPSWGEDMRPGRVVRVPSDPAVHDYFVDFGDGAAKNVALENLELVNPEWQVSSVGVLADLGFEGTEAYEHRRSALTALYAVRAATHGMTALISSAIELLPHQFEVARRVLEDPIQRYLLADEVGLGKTVEAGIIIRQYLLDQHDGHVLVLVPTPLVGQWRRELAHKFRVDEFGQRVQVVEFGKLNAAQPNHLGLVVVDEAHLLIDPDVDPRIDPKYLKLRQLAHGSERALLLSAIPIVRNERAMLAMLHLLDPGIHRLDLLDEFREKVRRQTDVIDFLLRLDPTAPDFLLADALADVAEALPDDSIVRDMASRAHRHPDELHRLVEELADYLTETHQVHHRLLRTSRVNLEIIGEGSSFGLLPRRGTVKTVIDEDPRIGPLSLDLEAWRERADAQTAGADAHVRTSLAGRFADLVDALGRGAEAFAETVHEQLEGVARGCMVAADSDRDLGHQVQLRLRAHEAEGERTVWAIESDSWVEQVWEGPHRTLAALAAVTSLLHDLDNGIGCARIVAFSSTRQFAIEIADTLADCIGSDKVFLVHEAVTDEKIEATIRQFGRAKRLAVLICDKSGEHGLNLQTAQGIAHLDLPLSPTRIEQRVGRLDRFGRTEPSIRHIVVQNGGRAENWSTTWLTTLQGGFEIFDRPISDVQFLVERLVPELRETVFDGGLEALTSWSQTLPTRLTAARDDLSNSFALARVIGGEEHLLQKAEDIRATDAAERDLSRSLDNWLREVVGLDVVGQPSQNFGRQYRIGQRTSLGQGSWKRWLEPALERSWTYSRRAAVTDSRLGLIRPGSVLLSRLEPILDRHDEGRTTAIWREVLSMPSGTRAPWVGLRFNMVVEASVATTVLSRNLDIGQEMLASLQRRADGYLAPVIETLVVDRDMRRIDDPELLALVTKASLDPTCVGIRDYELGCRPDALFSLVPRDRFSTWCAESAAAAVSLARSRADRSALIEAAVVRAQADLERRRRRYARRQSLTMSIQGAGNRSAHAELQALEAILDAVREPTIWIDAASVVVLASHPPEDA